MDYMGPDRVTVETNRSQTPKVQLGCGTLILIALIVMLFSDGGSNRKLRKEIEALNAKIDRLEKKIDALSANAAPVPPQPSPQTPQP
jgi:hypothetical protein